MNICIINNRYGKYSRGGAENYCQIIKTGLEKQGHRVVVISTCPWFRESNKEPDTEYYLPSLHHFWERMPKPFRLFWHIGDFLNIHQIVRVKKILQKERVDLVISNNLKGLSLLTPLMLQRLGVKHIHVLHDIQLLHPSGLMLYGQEEALETMLAKAYQIINRYIFKNCCKVISPSKWLLGLHQKKKFFSQSQVYRVINPVINERPNDQVKSTDIKNSLLFVGQINKHKGVELLLASYIKAKEQLQSNALDLNIVGDGPLLRKIKALAREEPGIKIHGKLKPSQISQMMKNSDYLIVPSLCYENQPTVILEAQKQGLSVIATDIGGNIELVELFGGRLFMPDVNALAETIVESTKKPNHKTRLGAKSITLPGVDDYVSKLLKIVG